MTSIKKLRKTPKNQYCIYESVKDIKFEGGQEVAIPLCRLKQNALMCMF
jgi:hypothetical protein